MTRRELERRRKQVETAKELATNEENCCQAKNEESVGRPSAVVKKLEVVPGQEYIAISRVSSRQQKLNGDLDDQDWYVTKHITDRGGKVIDHVKHLGKGPNLEWLKEASNIALNRRAILVAESTDRYVRHPDAYQGRKNQRLLPRTEDIERLRKMLNGAKATTILNPEAEIEEVWAHQHNRGIEAKRINGRNKDKYNGYKNDIRNEKLSRAIWLRNKGRSIQQIANKLGEKKPTIQKWLERSSCTATV